MDPSGFLSNSPDFNLLSLRDLLEARDLYHAHLIHRKNVVATAIGRYLIRRTDPWPTRSGEPGRKSEAAAPAAPRGERTLENSEVRPYSWPCILVFVDRWAEPAEFGRSEELHPDDIIPRAVYMPDGRVVPLCVVKAEPVEVTNTEVDRLTYPEALIGGGYPVLAEVQGAEHVASIGCLVSDGHLVYALTNRHVSGGPGETVYTLLDGQKVPIGVSSEKQLTRKLFHEVYDDWPGKLVYLNLDIGLIEIEDRSRWTARVYGLGMMGKMADLSSANISLKLIGCPLAAYGCASHAVRGAVHALFYRYKSVGGFEDVSDFLIGPRKDPSDPTGERNLPFDTRPGDSGTVWMLETGAVDDPDARLMPMAVQWGGHVFAGAATRTRMPFALATCLSTVCSLLNVDLVRDWNLDVADYWGAVGHYTIAAKACDALPAGRLRDLMQANLENITYNAGEIDQNTGKGLSTAEFVPLADVPDMVWKLRRHDDGGRGEPEHPNHFADMDKPQPGGGPSLLQICTDGNGRVNPEKVAVAVWQQYYDAVQDSSRGLLPFRVWQFYQEMVKFAAAGDAARFVCAAGIMAHYVGDACQPLHISYMFNGDPGRPVPPPPGFHSRNGGAPDTVPAGTGVHSAYEDGMVNYHIAEIKAGVDGRLNGGPDGRPAVSSGHDAAVAVTELMQRTFATIQPVDIVNAYIQAQGQGLKPKETADALWQQFGTATTEVIARGSSYLALLWESAWQAGNGDANVRDGESIPRETLISLYSDPSFLPSLTLDQIEPALT